MDPTRLLLFALALPAALGFIVGAMGARSPAPPAPPAAPPQPADKSRAPSALLFDFITILVLALLAGALTLAQYGVAGPSQWPPITAADRFRFVPAALLALCILVMLARVKPGARGWLIALGGGGLGAAVVGSSSAGLPSTLLITAFAISSLITTAALIRLQDHSRRVAASVVLVGLGLAVAAALVGTGSVELGKHGFALTAILAGIATAALALRGPIRPMTIAIVSATLSTLLAYGLLFSSTPWWTAALLAAVAPAAGLTQLLAAKRASPRLSATLAITAAAIIAAIAVAPGIKSLADFITATDTHAE